MFQRILPLFALVFFTCSTNETSLRVEAVPSPAGSNTGEPYLFTGPAGEVFLSWIESQDTVNQLNYARWSGLQWSEPITITRGSNWFVNWADYPMMVSNGRGKLMAAFLEKSSDEKFSYDIKITTSTGDDAWGLPHTLHDDGKMAEHGFVSLIPYGEQVFVCWLDGRNSASDNTPHSRHNHSGEMALRAAVLNDNGRKSAEWELDNRTCDCCQTTAAITTNGPVVIYRDRSEEEIRDISIVRHVNGQWTAPQPVHSDNWQINGCPVNGPRCEALGNTLAVAWFTMASDVPVVKVAFSADGGETFDEPIQISENETIGRVDLVLLSEQSAIVSWMEGTDIKTAKVYRNGQVNTKTTIARSSEARSSGFPQITKAGSSLIIAWTDSDLGTIRTAKLTID
jgi:hypothetical protein